MLIPSKDLKRAHGASSLSRRVNANSQREYNKGEGDWQAYQEG